MTHFKDYILKGIIIFFLLLALSLSSLGQIPGGYYNGTEGLEKETLKAALNNIIKNHTVYTYTSTNTDTWDILKQSDADPNNPANVIFVYSGRSVNGAQEYNSGSGWTREHVWPNSRGDFGTTRGAGTDLHNLKPCDVSVNSARSNRWFNYADSYYIDNGFNTGSKTSYNDFVWEPRDEVKGDIARIIFYMATRYEGLGSELDLEVVGYYPNDDSKEPLMSLLQTLKVWHEIDPVDDFERNRNNVIHSYQHNRNPFIDHPEFVSKIWGPILTPEKGLFISEYIEGNNYDKAIEIYNNTDVPVDLAKVKLQKDTNGDNSFSSSLSLSGTLSPKDVYVIAHANASTAIKNKADLNTSSTVLTFNGDDQLRLLYNGIEIDHIGNSSNYGKDRTFIRSGAVMNGSITQIDPALTEDWIELENENINYLGYHYTNMTIKIPEIFISEYIEGSSYNKAIEIYNASGNDINLNDIALLKQANGTGGYSGFSLNGTLPSYTVYGIVHPSASSILKDKADLQIKGGVMDFNGNDPIMLTYKGVVVDLIGRSGGSDFGKDKGFVRKSNINLPIYPWNNLDWNTLSTNNFSNFGEHNCDVEPGHSYDNLYAIASGDWSDPTIWSDTEGGEPVNVIPNKNSTVHIKNFQVTILQDGECAGIVLNSKTNNPTILNIAGCNLQVYGDVVLNKSNSNGIVELKVDTNGSLNNK